MDPNLPFQPPAPVEPVQPVQPLVPAMPPMESTPVPPAIKKTNWVLILGIVLLLVSVLALVGYYLYQNSQSRVSVSTPIALTSISPIATTDPTADWKTYTNQKALFTFKYPTQFKVDPDCIENKTCNGSFLTLTGIDMHVDQFLTSNNCQNLTNSSWSGTVKKSIIKIDSLDSLLISSDNFKSEGNPISQLRAICTTIGNGSVKIQMQTPKSSGNIEIFDQILSTSKFTEVSPSPSSTPSSTSSATPTATPL